MEKILICTGNNGKFLEISDLLKDLNVKSQSLKDVGIDFEPSENGNTYEENAALKVEAYGKAVNMLAIADDAGIEVEALNGMPGIHAKRFFKSSHEERNRQLLNMVKNNPNKKAKFVSGVAVFNPKTNVTKTFRGAVVGELVEPKGKAHIDLGYDTILKINKIGKTFGECSIAEKNAVSHRGIAVGKAKVYLKSVLRGQDEN